MKHIIAAVLLLAATPLVADHMPPTDTEIPFTQLIQLPIPVDMFWYEIDGETRLCARAMGAIGLTEQGQPIPGFSGNCLSMAEIQAMPKYTSPAGSDSGV